MPSISQKAERDLIQRLVGVLLHGQKICQNLGWMMLISESIPHWHTCMYSQLFHQFLRETAIFDTIVHTSKHARGILYRFLISNMRAVWTKIGNASPLIKGGNFKRTACTR